MSIPPELLAEIYDCCRDQSSFERLTDLIFAILNPSKISDDLTRPAPQESDGSLSHSLQTERLITLGQLIAGTAHEINNPVSFVYGNIVHLQQYTTDLTMLIGEYRQQLQMVHPDVAKTIQSLEQDIDLDFVLDDLPKTLTSMKMGVERIRSIVGALKNFSRTDMAVPSPCQLQDGLTNALLILQHRTHSRADGKVIQIIENYESIPFIECYYGQINQVFINLIGNAIDALENYQLGESFQPVIVITTALHPGGDRVVISIQDNGPGIPEAIQPQLFDRFFTTKPPGKGTGLGLAIVQEIVTQNHQGEVLCQSSSEGTTFQIVLPIKHPSSVSEDNNNLQNTP